MMTLLVDMNARLATNEQRVESLAAEKEARSHILFTAPDEPCTSRGATRRGVTTGPWLPDHNTFSEVAEDIRATVASHLKGAHALYLQTTNEDSASDCSQMGEEGPQIWQAEYGRYYGA